MPNPPVIFHYNDLMSHHKTLVEILALLGIRAVDTIGPTITLTYANGSTAKIVDITGRGRNNG